MIGENQFENAIGSAWLFAEPGTILLAPVVLLLVLAGLAGVIALLSNSATRVATVVVLVVVLAVLVLGGLFTIPHRVETARQEAASAEVRDVEHALRAKIEASRQHGEPVTRPVAPPPAPSPVPPAQASRAKGNIFRAIVQAFTGTGKHGSPTPAEAPAVQSPETGPLPVAERADPPSVQRPAWIGSRPSRSGNVYSTSTSVGPATSPQQRDAEVPDALQAALAEYVQQDLGPEAAAALQLPPDELQRLVVKESWDEPVPPPGWEQPVRHLRLEFDGRVQERVKDAWHQVLVTARLWRAGIGLAAVLGLLAVVFACLRIDQATRGSNRVRLGLVVTLLVVVVMGMAIMIS
jgi:hypothetical protein